MTVIDATAHDLPTAPAAVTWDLTAGIARVVVRGTFSTTVSAMAREALLDACEQLPAALELVIEATVDPADADELRHLVDVAQRRCWAASCRLEVTALDPGACEALAAAGIWPGAGARSGCR